MEFSTGRGLYRIKDILAVLSLLATILECSQAVTITKLPLPGAYEDAIVGKGTATFLTPDEAARVRRQQSSDTVRTSYNTDKISGSDDTAATHRGEPGFYRGQNSAVGGGNERWKYGDGGGNDQYGGSNRFEENSVRGNERPEYRPNYGKGDRNNDYNYNNEIPDERYRPKLNNREYFPPYGLGMTNRKYAPECRGRCGSGNGNEDIPPRVVFIQPDPGYHTRVPARGPDGYQGSDRRDPEDYRGSDRRGSGEYSGSNRRGPGGYQENGWIYSESDRDNYRRGSDERGSTSSDDYSKSDGQWDSRNYETSYRNSDPPGEVSRGDRLGERGYYSGPNSNRGTGRAGMTRDFDRGSSWDSREQTRGYSGGERYEGDGSGRESDSRRPSEPPGDLRRGRWGRACRETPGGRGCQESGDEEGTVGFYGRARRN